MLRKILYVLVLLIFSFAFLEIGLSFIGHKPGKLYYYENFQKVDSVETYIFYETDEFGIFKLSPFITDSFIKYFDFKDSRVTNDELARKIRVTEGIDRVLQDFNHLLYQIKNEISPFSGKYDSMEKDWNTLFPLAAKESILNGLEDAEMYRQYLQKPFNTDGFRSIDFSLNIEGRKRILLIGDSFGWGMSAEPIFNSYADILLAKGYIIYNAGISGTDPPQYEAIVRKYVPKLMPDLVIVNFFAGNDFMPFYRDPVPEKPIEHLTNAGFLESHPLGEYMEPEEAVQFYFDLISIPEIEHNLFNRIFAKSNVLTKFWHLLFDLGVVEHEKLSAYNALLDMPQEQKAEITSVYMSNIAEVCARYDVPLLHIVIPEKPFMFNKNKPFGNKAVNKAALDILYGGKPYYYPQNLTLNDYERWGTHYNNSGALKHAVFIDSLVRTIYFQ